MLQIFRDVFGVNNEPIGCAALRMYRDGRAEPFEVLFFHLRPSGDFDGVAYPFTSLRAAMAHYKAL